MSTPEAPLLHDSSGPFHSTPLGQQSGSPSNDLIFPDPSIRLDFEGVELEVLGDESQGDDFDDCRVEIGDFGGEVSRQKEEEVEEEEEEGGKSDITRQSAVKL